MQLEVENGSRCFCPVMPASGRATFSNVSSMFHCAYLELVTGNKSELESGILLGRTDCESGWVNEVVECLRVVTAVTPISLPYSFLPTQVRWRTAYGRVILRETH